MAIELKQNNTKHDSENHNSTKNSGGRYGSIKNSSENRLKRFGWVKRIIQSNKLNNNNTSFNNSRTRKHGYKEDKATNTQEAKTIQREELYTEHTSEIIDMNQQAVNNTTIIINECVTGGSLSTVTHENDGVTDSINDTDYMSNTSLYVVDDNEGFQSSSFLSNDNTSLDDMVEDEITCNLTSVFDGSVIHSGTPQTSVASGLLVPMTTPSSNYAYNNPIQGSVNLTGSGISNGYSRSIANSLLNNNDSSSIITLASSTRNVLNRSKSGRRSIETYNSSTVGIPPSSMIERLNRGLSTGNIPYSEDDDIYSLNNSLRTHSHINSRFGDAHSFRSYRTGRLSVND